MYIIIHLEGTLHVYVLYIYRVAKTHRMPYLHRSFSAKEPCN